MNLLFISNLFPDTTQPWRGLDNATALAALHRVRPEWKIQALCIRPSIRPVKLKCRDEDTWLSPRFANAFYIPRAGGWNHHFFARAVMRNMQGLKPDALLCSWLFPDACGVQLALPKIPQVSIAQGSDVHRYLTMPARRRAIMKLAATTSAIITRSADLKKRMVSCGAEADRIHPVYNGVHHEVFKPANQLEVRRELGWSEDEKVVLFVGNFLPVKGIDLLMESCAQARPKPRLVLIGNGPLETSLREHTQRLGVDANFAGRHGAESVARHMQAADVVCLSSHNEGVPNVLLEAMACGKPVVSSNVGGIHEVVPVGDGLGRLVDGREAQRYAAALTEVLNQTTRSEQLVAHAQQFTWQATAEAYARLLEGSCSDR